MLCLNLCSVDRGRIEIVLGDCNAFSSDLCINKEEVIRKNFFSVPWIPISVSTALKRQENIGNFCEDLVSWKVGGNLCVQKKPNPTPNKQKNSGFNHVKYFAFILFPKCLKSLWMKCKTVLLVI